MAMALAVLAGSAGSALAITTTMTSTSNWVGGTWDNGDPGDGDDAVISAGVTGSAVNSVNPWSGSLTLEAGSLLIVQSTVNPNVADLAIDGATAFTLADGGRIRDNFKTYTFTSGFDISGVAGMDASGPNSGWNQNRTFTAPISGTGTWTTKGYNHMGYTYNVANTFTGGYVIESGDRHGVGFNAPGAAGAGDVTVNAAGNGRSAVIRLGANDVFAATATLSLNGAGWNSSTGGFGPYSFYSGSSYNIDLNGFDATVSELYVNGIQQAAGTYAGGDATWIGDRAGGGTLTVTNGAGDTTPPTLASADIVDNRSGGPILNSDVVIYSVTFSESMNPATVDVTDFENAGSPAATINSVNPTGNQAVFEVSVTPGGAGTLQLQVAAGASLEDLSGNELDTSVSIADDTTITVTADMTPPTLAASGIVDDKSGGPIFASQTVTFTVTFSEPMDALTVEPADFANAGSPAAIINSVTATGDPAVFEVSVTPGGAGTLQLQIAAGAELADLAGNAVDTSTAIADDTIITVNAGSTPPTTMTASSNWLGGSWDNGEPNGTVDAAIDTGVTGTAINSVTPWSGSLILKAGALLIVQSTVNPNAADLAIDGATAFTLADGARIRDNFKTYTFTSGFDVSGVAGMDASGPNSGWNQNRTFTAPISGSGSWTTKGYNHMGYTYNVANTFTGGYVIESGDRHGVGFNAPGSAGAGDVTVEGRAGDGRSAVIVLGADNVFNPSAKLTLNGMGWAESTGGFGPYANGPWTGNTVRIAMGTFNATVSELYIDDVQQEAGTYTGTDGDWIAGTGILTVLTGPGGDYDTWAALYPEADLADPDADLDGDGLSNDNERLFGLDPTDPASQNPFAVPLDAAAGTFSFTRRDDALTGLFSGVETSTDLVMWTEDTGAVLTPGAPDANGVETVAVTLSPGLLSAPKLFVRVVQDDGILFAANFEDDNDGFTMVTTAGSDWTFGAPSSSGLGGDVLAGNGGSTNCWGTDIGNPGEYAVPTITKLRSPVIDLTNVAGAQLSFAQALDLETNDRAVVNIIAEAGDTVIATVYTAADADINSADWEAVPAIDLAAGVGMKVRLEWAFTGGTLEYLGWYIDDVTVSETAP